MKTVGQFLKEARLRKSYSRSHLEGRTKIRRDFIEAIEEEKWEALPEYPVVLGFAKSIAGALELSQDQVLAFLRRDYPPKNLPINPKPDVESKFVWTPKLTFLAGVAVILFVILGYLGFQYVKFMRPPALAITAPQESQEIKDRTIVVSGKTDPGAVVKINNQPALVSETGDFSTEIEIAESMQQIEIKAISRSGKEATIMRNIQVKLD